MWFILYLLSILVFVGGAVVAVYHCVRYGTKWDKTNVGVALFILVSVALLAFSVALAASIALI